MKTTYIDSSNPALDAELGYDGMEIVLEGLSEGRTRRYVFGPGVDEPLVAYLVTSTGTSRSWYLADERGSIVRQTNDAGNPGGAIGKYDEYGVGPGTSRFQYTGQYWLGDSNLHYYRARVYDPKLGRFLQPDPIGYQGGMNLYAYVGGDPVNFTDPLGLEPKEGEEEETEETIYVNGIPVGGSAGAMLLGGHSGASASNSPTVVEAAVVDTAYALKDTADVVGETIVITGKVAGQTLSIPARMSWYPLRWLGWKLGFNERPGKPYSVEMCGCLEAGTMIQTPTGLRSIEEIKVGDIVLSIDEKSGEVGSKAVTALIRPAPKPLYLLKVADPTEETEEFNATEDHPWKVKAKGWVETIDLEPGDQIETALGKVLTVRFVTRTARVEATYNLEVADWHTFLVGEDQAVVHNACRSLFERAGITTADHFEGRLKGRDPRGISPRKALSTYRKGRLFYDPLTGRYVRHSSAWGISVVTDAPSGGRAITVFEGKPSSRWVPIKWRSGQ